jgi:hypothetical protein
VLIADTRNVRAMTHAKVNNDRVDARMIAKLLAAGMLPGVWICDEATRVLRRRIARRTQPVRGRTRTGDPGPVTAASMLDGCTQVTADVGPRLRIRMAWIWLRAFGPVARANRPTSGRETSGPRIIR